MARLALAPLINVERIADVLDATLWRSSSQDPQLIAMGELPWGGDTLFRFELDVLQVDGADGVPGLYFDFGSGFEAFNAIPMFRDAHSGLYRALARLEARPRRIRVDPCTERGEFLCSELVCTPVPEGSTPGLVQALLPSRLPRPNRVGAIVHLYYDELWPEISQYLRQITPLERLYVSVRDCAPPHIEKTIAAEFPFALVRRVPNRGRDVLPFLQWLDVAELQGVDILCKIHTKRSPHLEDGDGWRRDMLDKLVGNEAVVQAILEELRVDPSIGIIGAAGHVVPSSFFWERNAERVGQLAERMGRDLMGERFEYVAGSMFWARLAAFKPLRDLALAERDFEPEAGEIDGTLAHALERCFSVSALQAGMRVGESKSAALTKIQHFAPGPSRTYRQWIVAFEAPRAAYPQLARAEGHWPARPLISIAMPTYQTQREHLISAIESVLAQVYQHWELCIADDASTEPHVREILETYRKRDPRIKVTYRETNGHMSAATNSALTLATGEFVAFLDHDDELHPLALHYVAEAIVRNPDCQLVYTDEDKLGPDGDRQIPYFKCELNYELLLAQNMVCHLGCYRASRLRSIGGFREGFEGAQDYDLVLRFIEGLEPSQVIHVPHVLYHWRIYTGSTALGAQEKPYAHIAAHKAIAEHLARTGLRGEVVAAPEASGMNRVLFTLADPAPSVTIIIPTRDRADLLGLCVDSILTRTKYPSYTILIVDNGSREEATLALFERLKRLGVRVMRDESEFNFSAINNRAVAAAASDFVCLMNNDIEVVTPGWLEEMVTMADRPGIAAVGARLWYPDNRLQHGGVIVGLGGVAGHSHKHLPKGMPGYCCRAVVHQSLSAVTAACLLVRRSIYQEVGGFDETLKVAFNDVDFCLRLKAAGYRNVWTPYAEMIHHESASRGYEITPAKIARFEDEKRRIKERWGPGLLQDPAYSPNLSLDTEDFAMAWPPRAALVTSTAQSASEAEAVPS